MTDGSMGAMPATVAHIQWKGTVACIDLHCTCGTHSHVDDDFTYAVRCPTCSAVWELDPHITITRNDTYGGVIRDAWRPSDHPSHYPGDHDG